MKILFIRLSSIGDIVLTTPVIRCVKKQVKNAEVHFLLKKNYTAVLEHNPYIDKKFYFDDNISQTISQLKKEKYDVIIDLHKNFRTFRIKSALGVKNYSFDKLNFEKWLLVNFKIDRLPKKHIVDRYMEAVSALGVTNDGAGLDYFISADDEKVLNNLPATHKGENIAWVIGARHYTKRLPQEKMLSIARKIKSPVVILGGKEDFNRGEIIAMEDPDKFFNGCGSFTLNESAAFIKHAKAVITHDTGLMHIAAALGKKIISVWGNTVPEFGMYPYEVKSQKLKVKSEVSDLTNSSSIILEVKNLYCRPCSKIGFEKCPKSHFRCMREISEEIFEGL